MFCLRFKQRMTVVVPDFNSIQSVLDVCKVCDSCVLLISATRDPEEYGDTLLSSLLGEFILVFFVFFVLGSVPSERSLSGHTSVESPSLKY